jgi:hypothetical protein
MSALSRIYEATEAARELENMIAASEEAGGDITELEGHIDALAEKAENLPAAIDDLLTIVREIESRGEARKAEADRLKQRAKRDEVVAHWFKNQVLRIMQAQGMKKIEGQRWRATVATPGGKPAMEVFDDVPDEFMREIVTREIDKDAIRLELEQGRVLPFARLVEKFPYLRIS